MSHCPHCDYKPSPRLRHRLKRSLQLVLGASVTMTLAACYGTPPPMPEPCDDKGTSPCTPSQSASPDAGASPEASASPSAAPTE
ncbi:MAG: hypothetical protein CVV27_18270 [Candidatus Melainabacteria bacterium HGW-Melainabacteria-1]|nr:MAG: hypothetical protein CVV27_18270 [Candidatus Melainabacteria bacterium HGW-Melainabacteria-1]